MKIEFKKIPLLPSEFDFNSNSVKFSGTFSKMSSKLAKINANLSGLSEIDCCKCGQSFHIPLDEEVIFLLSDGIYSGEDEEDMIVIEVENHFVDFDEILQSELESLKSEYHICDNCKQNNDYVEIEY